MSAIGKVSRVSKSTASTVRDWILRCRTYWDTKATELVFGILAAGPIPGHIAIIMDGNRRYAQKTHVTVEQGYIEGVLLLEQVCGGLSLGHL